jgi:hypothetical protein
LALIVAMACGGDDSSEPRAITALPSATPTPQGESIGALPLERFVYEASLKLQGSGDDAKELLVSTRGIFVSPDQHSFTYQTELGEGEAQQQLVMVDESVWYREGDGPWQNLELEDEQVQGLLDVAFTALRPDFLGGAEFERVRANVIRLPSTEEFVNEVRAYHYQVGVEGRDYLDALQVGEEGLRSASDLQWDLWLARDGSWPVRLQATGTVAVDITVLETLELEAPTRWEIRIDISRPDDPTLTINTPEAGNTPEAD